MGVQQLLHVQGSLFSFLRVEHGQLSPLQLLPVITSETARRAPSGIPTTSPITFVEGGSVMSMCGWQGMGWEEIKTGVIRGFILSFCVRASWHVRGYNFV